MSGSIQAAVRNATSFQELLEIADKATVEVSFFGYSSFHADGYEGTLKIDALVIRTFEILKQNYEFNETERYFGKRLSLRVDAIYDRKVRIVANKFFIGRFISYIRDFIENFCYEVRMNRKSVHFMWTTGDSDFYKHYTIKQFQEVFRTNPKSPTVEYHPNRWYAPGEYHGPSITAEEVEWNQKAIREALGSN